jgi:hypothetical protein
LPCQIVWGQALTHYQPRSNYVNGAINAFVKPTADGYVPQNPRKNLFDGPGPHFPCFDIPEGATDVYGIITGRRRLEIGQIQSTVPLGSSLKDRFLFSDEGVLRNLTSDITPGKGWEIFGENSGICDGSYNADCQREGRCVLQGQHAGRGAIIGNEYSGWLVVTLKDLKEGIIILKLHTWHTPDESTVTADWTSVNNERNLRKAFPRAIEGHVIPNSHLDARQGHRSLGVRSTDTPPQPDTMAFEYAIDGKITSLPRDEFLGAVAQLQRVLQVLTILDDPNFTSEPKDVEIAVRMTGCGRDCTFGISHIYWA